MRFVNLWLSKPDMWYWQFSQTKKHIKSYIYIKMINVSYIENMVLTDNSINVANFGLDVGWS